MSAVSPCGDYGREYIPPLSVALSLLTFMTLGKVLRDICTLFIPCITHRVPDLKLAAFVAATERHEERVVERLGGGLLHLLHIDPPETRNSQCRRYDQALRTFSAPKSPTVRDPDQAGPRFSTAEYLLIEISSRTVTDRDLSSFFDAYVHLYKYTHDH